MKGAGRLRIEDVGDGEERGLTRDFLGGEAAGTEEVEACEGGEEEDAPTDKEEVECFRFADGGGEESIRSAEEEHNKGEGKGGEKGEEAEEEEDEREGDREGSTGKRGEERGGKE